MRLVIIPVERVVTLPVIGPEIIKVGFRNPQLSVLEWIATNAARKKRKTVGESLVVDGRAGHIHVVQAKTATKIEQFVVFLPAPGDVGKAVTGRDGSRRIEPTDGGARGFLSESGTDKD